MDCLTKFTEVNTMPFVQAPDGSALATEGIIRVFPPAFIEKPRQLYQEQGEISWYLHIQYTHESVNINGTQEECEALFRNLTGFSSNPTEGNPQEDQRLAFALLIDVGHAHEELRSCNYQLADTTLTAIEKNLKVYMHNH
jgi:hypothetical protein